MRPEEKRANASLHTRETRNSDLQSNTVTGTENCENLKKKHSNRRGKTNKKQSKQTTLWVYTASDARREKDETNKPQIEAKKREREREYRE